MGSQYLLAPWTIISCLVLAISMDKLLVVPPHFIVHSIHACRFTARIKDTAQVSVEQGQAVIKMILDDREIAASRPLLSYSLSSVILAKLLLLANPHVTQPCSQGTQRLHFHPTATHWTWNSHHLNPVVFGVPIRARAGGLGGRAC